MVSPGALVSLPVARRLRGAAGYAGCCLVAVGIGWGATQAILVRVVLALALVLIILALGLRMPRALLYSTLAWLVALGLVRRMLISVGDAGPTDPLLLVSPLAVAVLILAALRSGALASPSGMTKCVLAFNLLTVLSVLNPTQGGLLVGLAGLLFVLVPMAWFWVGRALVDDDTLSVVMRLIAGAALLSALYGLSQTLVGLTSFDRAWADRVGAEFAAIRVGNTIRAFGPFTSASDYTLYLAIAAIALLAASTRFRFTIVSLVPLAVVLVAIVLSGTRGNVVGVLLASGIILAARWSLGLTKAVMIGVGLVVVLVLSLGRVEPANFSDARTAPLLTRQVAGLANPLDDKESTVGIHLKLGALGLQSALSHPFGRGAGATTIAGSKFGGSAFGTETDPSNAAVGLGIPGLLLYLALVPMAVSRAYRRAHEERTVVTLFVLGVLVITGLQWLNGGNYASAPIVWLAIGWLDRPRDLDTAGEGEQALATT